MIYTCNTSTGSVYQVDMTNKTWKRLEEGQDKSTNPLRTTQGTFRKCSVPTVGHGITIWCEPITPGTAGRLIYTSDVTFYVET